MLLTESTCVTQPGVARKYTPKRMFVGLEFSGLASVSQHGFDHYRSLWATHQTPRQNSNSSLWTDETNK